ncbi:hypothetical protein BDA96_06G226500 [Sorghum bicolor]|uniref:Uncharacterized protein n=1 Tax=Sorghum bicolor TaxID=4558 RepID=A0A921QSH2_SORBI|nr:hypothetical protein BDA96_06G226500 [Sorghum bicolor]
MRDFAEHRRRLSGFFIKTSDLCSFQGLKKIRCMSHNTHTPEHHAKHCMHPWWIQSSKAGLMHA